MGTLRSRIWERSRIWKRLLRYRELKLLTSIGIKDEKSGRVLF
jgi:hypothetical protein